MPRQFLLQDLARAVQVALDGTACQPGHLLDLGQIEILQVMQADDQPLRCTQPFQRRAKMATSLQRLAQFSRPRPFIANTQFLGYFHRHHPLRLQPSPAQVLQRRGVSHP